MNGTSELTNLLWWASNNLTPEWSPETMAKGMARPRKEVSVFIRMDARVKGLTPMNGDGFLCPQVP